MRRQKIVALAAALSFLLPMGAWANHAIKVNSGQWQLIGIAGYYQVTGAGTEGQSADLANQQALIDYADLNDNITWDANNSASAMNTVGAPATELTAHFATANDYSGITFVNAPTIAGNDYLGLPYHAIVGLRALAIDGSEVTKAAISFNRPTAPAATNGKDYGASMRTMYIVSPLSSGEPDVMVVYASNLENQSFKISFKTDDTTWDFNNADESARDRVYTGTFSHLNTYDNPVSAGNGLTIIPFDSGEEGASNLIRSIANTFDMNVTDNINENFAELNSSNFQALEGNLTVYKYNPAAKLWAISRVEDTTPGTVGLQEITALNESASDGSTNLVNDSVTGDFVAWDRGYGYWVRLWQDASAVSADQPGILANSQMTSAASYDGKLSAGWNLLSFPDGTLRYATSGFLIDTPAEDLDVISPFGDAVVTLTTIAGIDECNTFNADVAARNTAAGNVNTLDVRCYFAGGTSVVLLSDKPFFVQQSTTPNAIAGTVTSLAGYTYAATDMIDVNGSVGERYALRSRLGEFAVVLEENADYNASGLPVADTLAIGLPSWYGVNPLKTDATAGAAALDTAFSTYMGANGVVPAYDTAVRAQVIGLDANSTTVGDLLLFASNNRFYVRDNTYIRVFDTYDNNGSIVTKSYGGNNYASAEVNWMLADGTRDCTVLTGAVNAVGTDVEAACIGKVTADDNLSVIFVSTNRLNFDIKETNTSSQLLRDRHIAAGELNATVYGAIRRAYQPSELVKSTVFSAANDATTHGTPATVNLTYTATWAEDFPNNGALYYMAGNGYKPEMFITAVTSDGGLTANAAGTVNWKALDVTRDPKEWFNSANDFELFWTEKERGYWVYLADGYTNPVTVGSVQTTSTSRVTKHFNNVLNLGEGEVFNWFDGYLSASVGGLVRTGYTSGESYNVRATVSGTPITMSTTGGVTSAAVTFTTYLSDFEVSGFRPTGIHDADVSASDGLGGRATGSTQISYVKPATPTVAFSGNSLTATSNQYATHVVLYDGNVTDLNPTAAYSGAIATAVDMSTVTGITYPAQQYFDANGTIPALATGLGSIVKDLRVIAATAPATDVMSVFSNMRSVPYIPAYSNTGHLTAVGESNVTVPTLYNVSIAGSGNEYGVAYRGANGVESTLIFKPMVRQDITGGTPMHANFTLGGHTAQIQWLSVYEGQVFYVYDRTNSKWYYGVFPGNAYSEVWGHAGYNLTLTEVTGITQGL